MSKNKNYIKSYIIKLKYDKLFTKIVESYIPLVMKIIQCK